jgi:hypothetical protein
LRRRAGDRRDIDVASFQEASDGTMCDEGRAMIRPFIASFVLVGSVTVARAQEPVPMLPGVPATTAEPPEKPLMASVTFSPIHLVFPVAELSAEIRVAPKMGVAVIGGVGTVTPTNSDESVFVYEVGLSPRYYVVGDFRQGVELGVEAVYLHASTDDQFMTTASAQGLAIGPYIGYKWVAKMGLTLEAQLGAAYLTLRGESSTATAEDSDVSVLLNLQVGWSF